MHFVLNRESFACNVVTRYGTAFVPMCRIAIIAFVLASNEGGDGRRNSSSHCVNFRPSYSGSRVPESAPEIMAMTSAAARTNPAMRQGFFITGPLPTKGETREQKCFALTQLVQHPRQNWRRFLFLCSLPSFAAIPRLYI